MKNTIKALLYFNIIVAIDAACIISFVYEYIIGDTFSYKIIVFIGLSTFVTYRI